MGRNHIGYVWVGAILAVSDALNILADEVCVQNLLSIILACSESHNFELTILYIPELYLKHVLDSTGF